MNKIEGGQSFTRAEFDKKTFNKETRTIDVTFATETPVFRSPWWADESYNEVLMCDPSSVRMDRCKDGLPVFDNHMSGGVTTQLGRCNNIRFDGRTMVGTITFGARADESLISDIENGIITGISVGYNVYSYNRELQSKEKIPTYRATDWEPREVSFAPVQADVNSKTRSSEQIHTINIINLTRMTKTIEEIRAKGSDEEKNRLEAISKSCRSAKLSDEKVLEFYESDKTVEEIRQLIIESVKPENQEPVKVDIEQVRKEATEDQKKMFDAILVSTRAAKLDDSKAIEYFKSDRPLDEIRQSIIEEYAKSDTKISGMQVEVGKDGLEKKREAVEAALLHRVAPQSFKNDTVKGNPFVGRSLVNIAEMLLQERGVNTSNLTPTQIADFYFNKRDASTSDFPLLLEQLSNKLLRTDYPWHPEYWNMIAKETTVPNFKPKNFYQFDTANGMQEIKEGDELKYGKMSESKQTLSLSSYGEGILFTRRAMINDDLSAFEKIPQRFVLDWETMQGDLIWGMLTNNVTMDDNKGLFHADHKNLAAGGDKGILSATTLQTAIIAFKRQYGITGKRRIRVQPKYVIVGPEQEIAAYQLLNKAIVPTQVSQVNFFSAMGLEVIVEPRLGAKEWYLAADPGAIDGLYYAYLDGNGGLRSQRVEDFDRDSIKFAVRGEFGCAAIDYRGWYKNPGE